MSTPGRCINSYEQVQSLIHVHENSLTIFKIKELDRRKGGESKHLGHVSLEIRERKFLGFPLLEVS